MKKEVCITLFLCLVGCSTDYQKSGLSGGYQDMKLSDNVYMVEYYSNAYTSPSTNVKHALHRAAELTKQKGYRYFEISNSEDSSSSYTTPIVATTTVDTHSSTYGTYSNFGSFNAYSDGYGDASTTISGGNTFLKPGVAFIVVMLNNKTNRSFDANAILSNY